MHEKTKTGYTKKELKALPIGTVVATYHERFLVTMGGIVSDAGCMYTFRDLADSYGHVLQVVLEAKK